MRTLIPPPRPSEWEVTCTCKAVLAYSESDVLWNRPLLHSYVVCPHCDERLEVHENAKFRTPVRSIDPNDKLNWGET